MEWKGREELAVRRRARRRVARHALQHGAVAVIVGAGLAAAHWAADPPPRPSVVERPPDAVRVVSQAVGVVGLQVPERVCR